MLHLQLSGVKILLSSGGRAFPGLWLLSMDSCPAAEPLVTCTVAMQHLAKHSPMQPESVLLVCHELLLATSAEASVACCRTAAV